MANHGKPMNSCRVQFVVRNMDTKDKTLQINSVECKISDTRRITIRFIKSNKTSENQRFSEVLLFASYPKSAQYTAISGVQKGSKEFYTEIAPFLGDIGLLFNILRRLRLLYTCFLRELQREQYADNTALLSKYAKL